MKKYVFFVCLLFLMLVCFAFKSSTENTFPLFGKVIVVDVGHGKEDPGSVVNGEYEKDYNLSFAKTLSEVLSSNGASVVMTRDGDYDLSSPNTRSRKRSDFDNRIRLIDERNADMYLSLHMNYLSDSSYYGGQVFYSDVNNQNEIIADAIQSEFNKFFNFDKETKKIGNDKYLYRNLKTNGVLIEFGFMSNYKDRKNLKNEEYRINLAKVIAKGVLNYYNV